MTADLNAAADFMATHARTLDRHRFEVAIGAGEPALVVRALAGYRNDDGGYGWGLEPDLRSAESQPGCALHAFEAFADAAPLTSPHAVELCDWLDSISLADGGVPFALPVGRPAGTAPWWATADSARSSLQITAAVVSTAAATARHDPAVADHPWFERAVRYCIDAVAALDGRPPAIELKFAVEVLDAVHDVHPDAPALLGKLGSYVPPSGCIQVEGGTPDEMIRPLDLAPYPDRPARRLFDAAVVQAELADLAAQQQADGGWPVIWATQSPVATLEWRGILTVRAVTILRRAGLV
jgi:hypothetical protein